MMIQMASKDIQLILSKRLTKKNMPVLYHYVTYGASARRNLSYQFFAMKGENGFITSKGWTPS